MWTDVCMKTAGFMERLTIVWEHWHPNGDMANVDEDRL